MAIDADISARISILRSCMIFGIVVLHTPLYVPIDEVGPHAFDMLKAFFQSAVFRCTVPVLTLVSGYLLFGSSAVARPLSLISSKFKTLVIPFLVFNLPLAAIVFVLQLRGPLAVSYQLVPLNLGTLLDATLSLTAAPVNYPLYFLRDLFVLCVLAPVFAILLRRAPLAGLFLVAGFFLLNFDGPLVIRTDMPVTFYLGGLCAVYKVDMRQLDKYAAPCLGVFLVLCGAVVVFKVKNTTGLRLASPLLVWSAASLLVGTRFGTWLAGMSKYSFFIFLMHAPVLMATWMIYSRYPAVLPYPVYWMIAPLITTALLVGLYRLSNENIPHLFAWACGAKSTRDAPGGQRIVFNR
jgi:succinoglycan biosynthesis protein ExoH